MKIIMGRRSTIYTRQRDRFWKHSWPIKKMDLQIVSTELIKPSVPTPHHLTNFKLSFIDQLLPPFYIPLTLFYNTKFDLSYVSEIHNHLKKSLSETLTIFYPLAGRIQSPVSVDCNDQGVSYTEAVARCTLSEFLKAPHLNSLNKFLPLDTNVLKDVGKEQPLVSLQVTVLECGGLVIGVCVFHKICDCASIVSFLRSWTGFFKGDEKAKIHQDLTLGSSLFPPLSSFPDDYESNSTNFFFNEGNHSITRRFVFDVSSIATLRAKATSEKVSNPSRIEALTCFIVERLMAGLESRSKKPPESLAIFHVVNIRRRLDPPLPDTAFGNLIRFGAAFYTTSRIYVETLREAILEINNENIIKLPLEPEETIAAINEMHAEVNIRSDEAVIKVFKFTSWCNMGLYQLDFGWGEPCWVAHMADASRDSRAIDQFLFLEGKMDGEIELWALLDEHEMGLLENDQQFTSFATPNPSIPLDNN